MNAIGKVLGKMFGSRKFLLTVGAAVTAIGSGHITEAIGVVVAYVLAQAHVDAKNVEQTGTPQ